MIQNPSCQSLHVYCLIFIFFVSILIMYRRIFNILDEVHFSSENSQYGPISVKVRCSAGVKFSVICSNEDLHCSALEGSSGTSVDYYLDNFFDLWNISDVCIFSFSFRLIWRHQAKMIFPLRLFFNIFLYGSIQGFLQFPYLYQRCRWDFKFGWASSNVVGIICPPSCM